MNLFSLLLWKTSHTLRSSKSPEEFKTGFREFVSYNRRVNLTGEFISDQEFRMEPETQFVQIKSFERETAYIKGRISRGLPGGTKVEFTVRPNSLFPVFTYLFPTIGLLILTSAEPGARPDLIGYVLSFVAPAVNIGSGIYARYRIRKDFTETFNLLPDNGLIRYP